MMDWWLSVFFLIGGAWTSGDKFDGWSPLKYQTLEECEHRRLFAQAQSDSHSLGFETRWICSYGKPADPPLPPPVIAMDEK